MDMLNRRQVLLSGAATAALASSGVAFAADSGTKLDALFDAFMAANLDRSPETTTSLGLDSGARAWEKSKLDDRSLASIAGDKARNAEQLKQLQAFDRGSL